MREPRDERQHALEQAGEMEMERLALRRALDHGRRRPMATGPQKLRTRTSTGVEIGGAYVEKPPAPSGDAERIQRAFLSSRRAEHFKPERAPSMLWRIVGRVSFGAVCLLLFWLASFALFGSAP